MIEHEFLQDPVYLCVPEGLLQQYYSPEEIQAVKARARGRRSGRFRPAPFSMMDTRLGRLLQERFKRAGIRPNVFFTSPSSSQIMPLCAMGVTACFATHMALLAIWISWGLE